MLLPVLICMYAMMVACMLKSGGCIVRRRIRRTGPGRLWCCSVGSLCCESWCMWRCGSRQLRLVRTSIDDSRGTVQLVCGAGTLEFCGAASIAIIPSSCNGVAALSFFDAYNLLLAG